MNILELYQRIFKVTNYFLNRSKKFTVQELKQHNVTSYTKLARLAKSFAFILDSLAGAGTWDEERIAANAKQAANLMSRMADYIDKENQEGLQECIDQLESMTFI